MAKCAAQPSLPPQRPEELLLYLGVTMEEVTGSGDAKRPRLANTDSDVSIESLATPTPRRKATMIDSTGDGRADLLYVDTTGDGRPDMACQSYGVDTTGDGRTDTLIADTTGDGEGDSLVLDTTGDGIPDTVVPALLVDTNGDGKPDMAMIDDEEGAVSPLVVIHGAEASSLHRVGGASPEAATSTAPAAAAAAAAASGCASAPPSVVPRKPRPLASSVSSPHALPAVTPEEPSAKRPRASTSGCGKQGWTQEEDEHILAMVAALGTKWSKVAHDLPGRTDDAVRNRYLRLKRKMPADDIVADKKGDMWTPEEDVAICSAVDELGQKWPEIAELLPGRSANAIRNRFLRVLRPSEAAHSKRGPQQAAPLAPGAPAAFAAAPTAAAAATVAVAP